MRQLRDEEMDAYRAPFATVESRRSVLALSRELPIKSEPENVWRMLAAAHQALAASTYPKLLLFGEPGAFVTSTFAESFAATLKGCRAQSWSGFTLSSGRSRDCDRACDQRLDRGNRNGGARRIARRVIAKCAAARQQPALARFWQAPDVVRPRRYARQRVAAHRKEYRARIVRTDDFFLWGPHSLKIFGRQIGVDMAVMTTKKNEDGRPEHADLTAHVQGEQLLVHGL